MTKKKEGTRTCHARWPSLACFCHCWHGRNFYTKEWCGVISLHRPTAVLLNLTTHTTFEQLSAIDIHVWRTGRRSCSFEYFVSLLVCSSYNMCHRTRYIRWVSDLT